MGDHLDYSSIHDVIDVPQFHYDGFHKVGPEFDKDMLINIGKTWMKKIMMNFTTHFRMRKGILKGWVIESRIAWIKTLSSSTKMLAVHPCYIPFPQPLFSQRHYIDIPSLLNFIKDILQQQHNTMI